MKTLRSGSWREESGETPLVTRSRAIDAVSFRAVLSAFDSPRAVWTAPGEPTVVGCEAAATLVADREAEDRFAAVREAADDLFAAFDAGATPDPARPRLFGGFAFHDDHDPDGEWDGFPAGYFFLPRVQVARDGEDAWLTVTAVDPGDPDAVEERLDSLTEELRALPAPGPTADPPGVVERRPTTSKAEWRDQVDDALERIAGGDLQKVVLAQALGVSLESPLSTPDALARLRSTYPDCYRFLVDPGDGGRSFFGATPERLVSLSGRELETEALAGSTGRGDTPEEDEWLARDLLESEKDVHEHQLVVEAIREQLSPYAASIRTGQRTIRKLDSVQHLRTPLSAELVDVEHVLDLVEALHPTPAVGGLPPDLAWRTIRETETFDRGWYAAPVGWFDAAGNGTFAVAIRSAVASGTDATLFAGAGIVADSDADREWDEVQLKYRPMLDTLE
ncbi:isochorismate synthase [Halostella sp. JP-L12]|uniref:isochorismate synthase n=1 Tax=Halostella TaxID=1843185 RepID=UPI000EF79A95|nr:MULTISPECIES: isochorismate synthase [Halostella]NHN49668.1 isochorismate synthase [Halostella sp. JP-L12]